MATTDHNEITLTKRNQSKVVRSLSLPTTTNEKPHNIMIIANSIFYNGQSAERVYLGENLVWEKTVTPPTPTYGSKTFAGKFADTSTESYWKFWPNGNSGNGTSIKDYVDAETKEFQFEYEKPLTSCKYLLNGNGSYGRYERIDHIPDTSGVTNMNMMFANNASLISVNLSDLDTSKVTDMSMMFNGCRALTSLDVSNFDTINLTKMTMLVAGCNKLVTLNISGWSFDNLDFDYYFFQMDEELTTVLGPISGIHNEVRLHWCPLTNASAMVFINGLASISEAKSIYFKSSTYDSLTPEQLAIATSKGWNVVRS